MISLSAGVLCANCTTRSITLHVCNACNVRTAPSKHPPPALQASSFGGTERMVQDLWTPLAAYVPPSIELPPPPPPPAEEEQRAQPMVLQAAEQPEEEAMVDAVPEDSGLSADQLLGSVQAEPDVQLEAEPEGAAEEAVLLGVPQPGEGAAAEGQAAHIPEQPSLVAATAEAAAGDSEMAEGQAEDSTGSEDGGMDRMEDEQACSGGGQASSEEQGSSEERGSGEERSGSEEPGSGEGRSSSDEQGSGEERSGNEEQGSEGEQPSSVVEGSQGALPLTQPVESGILDVVTEPTLEQVSWLTVLYGCRVECSVLEGQQARAL